MQKIDDKSIDMILCDLPYGTTKNKWDSVIPLDKLWEQYERIIKDDGCIALFAQTPFDKVLGASNLKLLKYEWIWEKESGTGFLNSNYAPLKIHENILVFSKKSACYVKNKNDAMKYYPQKTVGKAYKCKQGRVGSNYDEKNTKETTTINNGDRYPTSILRFNRDKDKLHPTQKPVDLCEYLIRTYTNEDELILDNCIGSGTTAIAAINTNRNYIGFELDSTYCNIANRRIQNIERNT